MDNEFHLTIDEMELVKKAAEYFHLPENIDIHILFNALCHSSYAFEKSNKNTLMSNERLEFLGDSILDLIIAEYLYANFKYSEGEMSKIRGTVASEKVLSDIAKDIGLDKYLFLGIGEEKQAGREKPSILCDAVESFIAAIYISLGYEYTKNYFLNKLSPYLESTLKGKLFLDYKTKLQEITQEVFKVLPEYEVSEINKNNAKYYITRLTIKGKVYGIGEGPSKKISEQLAAKEACQKLEVNNINE